MSLLWIYVAASTTAEEQEIGLKAQHRSVTEVSEDPL